jgi:hypothetical protein
MRTPPKTRMNLLGRQFDRLTVIEEVERRGRVRQWRCICSCGGEIVVAQGNLTSGATRSCGCFHRERASAANLTHGLSNTTEHVIWSGMRARCSNPKHTAYADYGGRGITVCERWNSFQNFLADMGPRPSKQHSIDRIDVDGPYSPQNCRWATPSEQAQNKGSNRLVTFNGETTTISEWSRRLGIGAQLLGKRLDVLGWTVEHALATPARYHPRRT